MKQPTQSILMVLMLTFLLHISCKKDQHYMNDAIITGWDMRTCVCCGGLMITFNGETKPYTGDFKHIENSADLGITEKDTFPVYIKADWKLDTTNVCNHIIITRFIKR